MSLGIPASELIERIPGPAFGAVLALIAWASSRGRWPLALGMLLFMAGDWVLVALLPRFGVSYGPPQPQVLALAVLRAPFALLPTPLAFLALAVGTCLAAYGFWHEPRQVRVTRQALRSPKLGLGPGPPLRLLHFGDLHVERVTHRERELVRLVEALRPDLIVFTGDLLSMTRVHDPEAWEACRSVFAKLVAPLGVLLVAGSPAIDDDAIVETVLQGTPVRWLRDEIVTLTHHGRAFAVVGLSCTHKPFVDGPRLRHLLEEERQRTGDRPFTILLHHTPDLAPDAAEAGVDLQLSGHTHGGQVRLPLYGALITGCLYGKAFEMGRREVGGMTLHVTRGIGMEGSGAPRVRFLCPPEIVLWEIGGV